MSIGNKIRMRREILKLSQQKLSEELGYKSKTSIHKIEQDKTDLPLSKVMSFAKILKTTPAYLMGWEEDSELFVKNKKTNETENTKITKDLVLGCISDILETCSKSINKISQFKEELGISNNKKLEEFIKNIRDIESKGLELKKLLEQEKIDVFSKDNILENYQLKGGDQKEYDKLMSVLSTLFFDSKNISNLDKSKLESLIKEIFIKSSTTDKQKSNTKKQKFMTR